MGKFYEHILKPALFSLDAERAHEIGMLGLRLGLGTSAQRWVAKWLFDVPRFDPIEVFGVRFPNPLGVAAGFDKNAVVFNQLASLGFGFVETGTVTPHPQDGNPRPRMFRLPELNALVNRLGFNNHGVEMLARRIESSRRDCVVGVNIGKSKSTPNEEAWRDYLTCFERVKGIADYVVINVSSPNTPGLRSLQTIEGIAAIVKPLIAGNDVGVPLLLKLAPDLEETELKDLADFAVEMNLSGIVLTNTTVSRPDAKGMLDEPGGLSGAPLSSLSDRAIGTVFRHTDGKLPIIGVGGVFSGRDLMRKIGLGASLVQVYTGFVYGGPDFPSRILKDFKRIMESEGISEITRLRGSLA